MSVTTEVRQQDITVRSLLESGLHFGHQTKRWNPKMKRYIFDKRSGIHIIDLAKTIVMLREALKFLYEVAADGKGILLVGTKKQAREAVKEAAESCGQHYVVNRWLGGMLTNAATVRRSVARLREIEKLEVSGAFETMHKKEASKLKHELAKLRHNLTGVANMEKLPGALFVVDINREAIAVNEAAKLGIPVVAIVDTNCDPDPIDYPIPGNDDAIRAVKLISGLAADTVNKAQDEYRRIVAEKAAGEAAAGKAREEEKEKKKKEKKAAEEAAEKSKEKSGGKPEKAEEKKKPADAEKVETAAPAEESVSGKTADN
ncbi:MAG: 30S ribosomal protein S2 [Kiritimatiellia bacterium]